MCYDRILVIEDPKYISEGIVESLITDGLAVESKLVGSLKEALDFLDTNSKWPNAIIIDLELLDHQVNYGDIHNCDAVKTIRTKYDGPLIVRTYKGGPSIEECVLSGADAILPSRHNLPTDFIRDALALSRTRNSIRRDIKGVIEDSKVIRKTTKDSTLEKTKSAT